MRKKPRPILALLSELARVPFLAAIFIAFSVNVAAAETLESGAIVCRTKEGIKAYQAALASGETKKSEELISGGGCYRVDGNPRVAVTNACGPETRKILLNGDPVWCLSRQLR